MTIVPPFFTSNLAPVEDMARKALKDWTIEVQRDPCGAHVFDPAAADDDDKLRMAAWRDFNRSLLMEKPPADSATALTLAMMRGASRCISNKVNGLHGRHRWRGLKNQGRIQQLVFWQK